MEKKVDIFKVFPNKKAIIDLRKSYIDQNSNNDDLIISIVSSSDDWYKYDNGIFIVDKEEIFKTSVAKKTILCEQMLNEFVQLGASNKIHLKAVSYNDKIFYLIIWRDIRWNYNYYYLSQAANINEDLYNIEMILKHNYGATTTPEDLSRYSEFFTITDEHDTFNIDYFMCEAFEGKIKISKALEYTQHLEIQDKAIKSLKKR